MRILLGMRFRKQARTQDVIVSCCVLHNMRKKFDTRKKKYTSNEYQHQIQISQHLQRQPQQQRLQNYLIENYFIH